MVDTGFGASLCFAVDCAWVSGLGFRVQGSGFRVQGFQGRFRV